MSEMTATQEALERFCDNCVVRDQVRGSHGIMDRLNEIEKKQVELNVKLARLEWLVPIMTAALVALINWIPKIVATTAAAVR
jgi:hypothetical protein